MKRYSTPEAAKKLGLSLVSLHRYVAAGKIPTPSIFKPRTLKVLPWTEGDIEKIRKILPKIANGRKTRYQKERAKSKGSNKASKKK
jgi:predicted site-specific integrase-resolvase